jgi:hypothetical protein
MNDGTNKTGRPKSKAPGILFKLSRPMEKYLRRESEKTGKSMVRIVEELLEYRSRFRSFPPPTTIRPPTAGGLQKELMPINAEVTQ